MKTKLIIGFVAVIIAFVSSWNIDQKQDEIKLSNMVLQNVEALAQGESNIGSCTWYGCKMSFYTSCNVYTTLNGLIMSCPQMRS